MDQDRLKHMYEKVLFTTYEQPFYIKEFNVVETHQYDNLINEWIPDSYHIFILLSGERSIVNEYDMTKLLESIFGYECTVDFH
jgi:hypothetical protein